MPFYKQNEIIELKEGNRLNLGVQYYRAPFPEEKYWEKDIAKIKQSGLNTVQLWVLWGWVEPKPGEFIFDDYDRLVELADKNGLGVILSTIAAIQPLTGFTVRFPAAR